MGAAGAALATAACIGHGFRQVVRASSRSQVVVPSTHTDTADVNDTDTVDVNHGSERELRSALLLVNGLRPNLINRIASMRSMRPFDSLEDLQARVNSGVDPRD